jgi:gliding motility-associated-like protein
MVFSEIVLVYFMMNRFKRIIGLFFVFISGQLFSQQLPKLYINEYSAANVSRTNAKFKDFQGDSPDWFEIYNDETTKILDINGYYISDNANDKRRYRIPATPKVSIPPGGYAVIFCSGKDTVVSIGTKREVHTNFKLTQTKTKAEEIYLSDFNGALLDNVTIKRNQADHSWGRYFYGTTPVPVRTRKFYVYVRPTPGSFNDSNQVQRPGNTTPTIWAYIDYAKPPEMTTQPGLRAKGVAINFKDFYAAQSDQFVIKYSYSNQIPTRTIAGADTVPLKQTNALLQPSAYTGVTFDSGNIDSMYHTFTIKARYVPIDTSAFDYLPSFPITNTFFALGIADSIKVGSAKFALTLDSAQKLPIIHISNNRISSSTIAVETNDASAPDLVSDITVAKKFRLPHVFPLFSATNGDSIYSTFEYFEAGKRLGVYNGFVYRKGKKKRTVNFEQRNLAFKPDDEYGIVPAAAVDGQKGLTYQIKNKLFKNPVLNPDDKDKFKKILLRPAGNDNFFSPSDGTPLSADTVRQTHIRDGMAQSYAKKIGLNFETRNYQPVILFVNGRYHGVYDLRENFNNNYTKSNFKQGKGNVDIIKVDRFATPPLPQKRVREGSVSEWEALCKFIYKSNLKDPKIYEEVKSKLSISSLIDYMIYNQYIGNTHFTNTNVGIWRGKSPDGIKQKWRFFAYDMDNIYERSNSSSFVTGAFSSDPVGFKPCDYAKKYSNASFFDTTGIYEIFVRLYDSNFVFKSQYLFRFGSLMDGPLKCDSMVTHFEKVKDLMISQMKRHVANNSKKKYNYNGGQNAVFLKLVNSYEALKDAINRRCNYLDTSALTDCDTNIKSKKTVYVKILPDTVEVGEVSVNNNARYTTRNELLMKNVIYMNTRVEFEAASVNPNYVFDRWTTTNVKTKNNKGDSIADSPFSNAMHLTITKPDTIYANFRLVTKDQLDFPLQFPTAFSPNGDGRNDVFAPIGGSGDIAQYEMQIFNRWGELIYNTYDRARGWNGKQYGVDAPIGVYAYKITAIDVNNKKTEKVGNVTLLR